MGSQLAPPVLLEATAILLVSQCALSVLLAATAHLGSQLAPPVLLEATAILLASQCALSVLLEPAIPKPAAHLRQLARLASLQGTCASNKGLINRCCALQVTTALRV
jgi:hypothetical protein